MTKTRKYNRDGSAATYGTFEVVCDNCGKTVKCGRFFADGRELCYSCIITKGGTK